MDKGKININEEVILVTGAVGFIGANLIKRLLQEFSGVKVVGVDNINDYYDVSLKYYRLDEINCYENFVFLRVDISDRLALEEVFNKFCPTIVINLAAQAGVRYSIINPDVYIESNIIGFYNILENCRHNNIKHLIFASSSSVYGNNNKIPYTEEDIVDRPVSLYAATKKSNELMAYSYSKLYNIPVTGLRFFTVYGPCGRPDMSYFGFTNKLVKREKIQIFNYGNCQRDFTFIDDVIEGIVRIIIFRTQKCSRDDTDIGEGLLYRIYNIGNSSPVNLLQFIRILQEELTLAKVLPEDFNFDLYKELVPMQSGDVPITYADTTLLERDFGFKPKTSLREGLRRFAQWYALFYGER